jgi:hypothetical protein
LLTAITDDEQIWQGLFPTVGSNVSTSKGGGKKKVDFQWALCVALFKEHPKYALLFGQVATAKDRGVWTMKIKNRLRT